MTGNRGVTIAGVWRFRALVLCAAMAGAWAAGPRVLASGPRLTAAGVAAGDLARLTPAEFSGLIRTLSEPGGSYPSDNYTSNETSYLHVVEALRNRHVAGGAYIGVGPEQNFTYIATVHPQIAFIVDIRRQAMIQHLLYKAVFQLAASRAEFLALLLCRPLDRGEMLASDLPPERLLSRFEGRPPAPPPAFALNLGRIRDVIRRDFAYPLSPADERTLELVYSVFRSQGLGISYRSRPSDGAAANGFPTLRDLILQPDLHWNRGNLLASDEDFFFVKDLHQRNLIIPVVGDFAGPAALGGIGAYLRGRGLAVRAFYVSNVEQFLFEHGSFPRFVRNVRALPVDDESVFIRAFTLRGQFHPASVPGHLTATVLQRISVFLENDRRGLYVTYGDLLAKDNLIGKEPVMKPVVFRDTASRVSKGADSYVLEVNGQRPAAFRSAAGLDGPTRGPGRIVLRNGRADAGLIRWLEQRRRSRDVTDVVVLRRDPSGRVVAGFRAGGTRPVKIESGPLNASGTDVVIETVELTYEKLDLIR